MKTITRFIDPKVHGYLDYAAVLLLFIAPSLFDFTRTPATISYVLGTMQLLLSVLTAYPMGILRVIPFTVHAVIEFLVAVALVVLPWVTGFSDYDYSARNFFWIAGIGLFAVWALTDYKSAESTRTGHSIHMPGALRRH